MSVPLFLAEKISPAARLFADDGDFRIGNFQPHQAVIAVEQKQNLEVRRSDHEAFVGFAIGACRSFGFHSDRTRRQFLGNNNWKSLHAALGPIVDARKNRVLMVEIIVQNSDERRIECQVLLEWARSLHLQGNTRYAVGEEDM